MGIDLVGGVILWRLPGAVEIEAFEAYGSPEKLDP